MRTDEIIILVLYYSEKGMITGRTLLQKTLYFLNEKLSFKLDFTSYYYGPYCAEVKEVMGSLSRAGFVEETVETFSPLDFDVTFEPRRYRYEMTKVGKELASTIQSRDSKNAKKIKSILETMKRLGADDDYRTLSIAAKMHRILRIEGKSMTGERILEEARALDWKINAQEADAAMEFLKSMELINLRSR